MGTNFYAVIPMKSRNKKTLESLINQLQENFNKDNYNDLLLDVNILQEELNDMIKGTEIHLGKRSAGWSFCWDANELKYYKPSLKSIHKWIVDNKAIIQDEYGDIYSWDDFINNEIGYCLYSSKAIRSIEELPDNMNSETIKYIKEKYFDKHLPYYQYCSHRTYHIMHPNEPTYYYSNNHPDFTPYAKNKFVDDEYNEFHSKDGLRFATYTDFS